MRFNKEVGCNVTAVVATCTDGTTAGFSKNRTGSYCCDETRGQSDGTSLRDLLFYVLFRHTVSAPSFVETY